ncbi:hypothetical protein ACFLXU_07570 [Chloroflexota bacterium]
MGRPKFRRLEYDLYASLMRAKLPGSTYQVVLVVIDHTIGYRRETAGIPLSRFQYLTSLSRPGVIKAIKDAERRCILKVSRLGISPRTPVSYTLNTEYSEWVIGKRALTNTSKPQLTSKPVNDSIPDQLTGVYQTGKQLTPTTAT